MSTLVADQKPSNQDYYFEAGTLRSGLLIAACYEGVQLIRDALTQAPQANVIINSLALVALITLYLATKNKSSTFAFAAITHLVLLPVFFYFWVNYNGTRGSVPYFIFLYFPFIIFTLHGALRFLILGLYSLLITYLMVFPELFRIHTFTADTPEEIIGLSIDCLFSALLLSIFFIRVKKRFEKFRNQVVFRNKELSELKITLLTQNEQIKEQKAEVEKLNNDLNNLIEQRTREVETRNKMLGEYAFVNAHVLRGPLSRVLGLLNLMQLEQKNYSPEKVKEVHLAAKEMDLIIRKINDVLH